MYVHFFKRVLDFLLGLFAFILLFPLFLILTIVLAFINNGSPFFFQKRPGKNERVFRIIKFKSMKDTRDDTGKLLPDEDRIYPFGSFIRNASLDEIPQLLNVIKGDMSLVGPRPLRVHYLPFYTEREKKRHLVRPGVTGLAQVSGRNALDWDTKLEKDVEYVESISLRLDIKILLLTVKKVVKGSDVILDDNMQTFDEYRMNPKS